MCMVDYMRLGDSTQVVGLGRKEVLGWEVPGSAR